MFVACIPAWIRFTQCLRRYRDTRNKFPHLANALKYATFFFDTIALSLRYGFSKRYNHHDWENPYFYLWVFVRIISTCYKLGWDLKMDWGFFDKNAGENKFLREVCIYSSKVSVSANHLAFPNYCSSLLTVFCYLGLLLRSYNSKRFTQIYMACKTL